MVRRKGAMDRAPMSMDRTVERRVDVDAYIFSSERLEEAPSQFE